MTQKRNKNRTEEHWKIFELEKGVISWRFILHSKKE